VLNVTGKENPLVCIPESNIPFGLPGVPDVALWLLPAQVQLTISPVRMVTSLGSKLNTVCPTITFVVAARARTGSRIRNTRGSRKFTLQFFVAEPVRAAG
jgi:hypothetical protein